MTDFPTLLSTLSRAGVEFILIGGAAGIAHGAARLTLDIDVLYRRSRENCRRLTEALAPLNPYLRGAPPGLPFKWDASTVWNGLNFTLETEAGDIDVLGEIAGGDYESLHGECIEVSVFGVTCLCLNLEKLIEVKRAAGRPKDFEAIAELEAIREELQEDSDPP